MYRILTFTAFHDIMWRVYLLRGYYAIQSNKVLHKKTVISLRKNIRTFNDVMAI